MKKTLVTSYVCPDLDGTAGAFAYAEFLKKIGKEVEAGIFGEPHDEAKYVLERFNIPRPQTLTNCDNFDSVIIVDVSSLNLLEGKIPPEKVVEVIDHRKLHELEKFPNAKGQIELVGAVATLIAEKFMEGNVEISKESAVLLLGAVISNTLNFKGDLATERDRKAYDWLFLRAGVTKDFPKELFLAKSDLSGEKLINRMRSDFSWRESASKSVGIDQIEIIGAADLVKNRIGEMVEELKKMQEVTKLDFIFLNLLELEDAYNFFITHDSGTKILLEKTMGVKFEGDVARTTKLIMRKQISPLLKAELEKNS